MTSSVAVRQAGARPARPGRARRRWPFLVAVLLVLSLVAGTYVVIWHSPVLAVKTVAVSGVRGALAAKAKDVGQRQVGIPLISVDVTALQAELLADPTVAEASVQRRWPNTLAISMTPRIAVAVTNANGAWWQLDDSGLPFTSTPNRPPALPAVELATPGPQDAATTSAIAVITALPAQVRRRIAKVTAPTAYNVTLQLTDGRTVIWGDATRTELKARILPAVLTRPGRIFDLSEPQMVTVR